MNIRARRALVQGGGPAGWSVAMLLRQRGWQVDLVSAPPGAGPVVLLNPATLHLLCDVWGWSLQTLAGRWATVQALTERLVAWQSQALASSAPPPANRVAQSALALPLATLTSAMAAKAERAGVRNLAPGSADAGAYAWVIDATGRAGVPPEQLHRFGVRQARSVQVRLSPQAPAHCCVLEAVAGGWLFLIPQGQGTATLQAMVAEPGPLHQAADHLRTLVKRSHHLGALLADWQAPVAHWAAMPSVRRELARPGWLAVGDAALAHDPISGEGIGTGLRTALLAAAVLEATHAGEPTAACLAHYQQRLHHAALAHVRRCLALYQEVQGPQGAHQASTWQADLAAMRAGLAQFPGNDEGFQYALSKNGLQKLHPVPLMAG